MKKNSSSWYSILPRKSDVKLRKSSFDLASFYKLADKVNNIFKEEEKYLEQEQRKTKITYS